MSTEHIIRVAEAARQAILAQEDEIEGLDRAIGDGDHFHNVKRGLEAVAGMTAELESKGPDQALRAIAMKLLSTVGGASGPLSSSFLLAMSKTEGSAGKWDAPTFARMFRAGVAGVQARGKAGLGDKTMLDVLIPVAAALGEMAEDGRFSQDNADRLKSVAEEGMRSTRDIQARFGRAAFLGERAIGHTDPGAMSSYVIIAAACDALTETMA